jgi:hypothetical protein
MFYELEYNRYCEESESIGNEILSYDDWKESQGYRREYDSDNN